MKNSHLSKRVKELRNRKGISQNTLAEESALSLRTIQRIENQDQRRGSQQTNLSRVERVPFARVHSWRYYKCFLIYVFIRRLDY